MYLQENKSKKIKLKGWKRNVNERSNEEKPKKKKLKAQRKKK